MKCVYIWMGDLILFPRIGRGKTPQQVMRDSSIAIDVSLYLELTTEEREYGKKKRQEA